MRHDRQPLSGQPAPPLSADAPALSVVTPARGRMAALDALVADLARSAAAADWAVEIIVVDDASTPPLSPAPPPGPARLRLLRCDRRRGANGARRLGLEIARGRWIHFHDSDDGVPPGWVAAIRAAAESGPEVILTPRVDIVGGVEHRRAQSWAARHGGRPERLRRMLSFRNCLGPFGGVTFAREALAEVSFPALASCQDWAVYREVWRRAPRLTVADTWFVYRRDGSDRISASPRRKVLGMLAMARMDGDDPLPRSWRRLYHLHRARAWAAACGRADLDRLMRRSAPGRWLAHAAALGYMILVLRLR